MRSINRATLLGRVGSDPEVRTTGGGKKVAEFSVATSWGTGDQERTSWHRIIAWEKTADIVEQYVRKGDPLFVEGEINYRSYDDKDGNTRYVTEIRAFSVVLLPSGEKRQTATAGAKKSTTYDDFPADFPDSDPDLPF